MTGLRCSACHGHVAGGDAFCPHCGAPTGTLALEAPDGGGPDATAPEAEAGPTRRRTWLGIGAIAALLVGITAASLVVGRDHPATTTPSTTAPPSTLPPTTARPTTTTVPRAATTTRATTTTAPVPAFAVLDLEPPLPALFGDGIVTGTVLYGASATGRLARLDLDTGRLTLWGRRLGLFLWVPLVARAGGPCLLAAERVVCTAEGPEAAVTEIGAEVAGGAISDIGPVPDPGRLGVVVEPSGEQGWLVRSVAVAGPPDPSPPVELCKGCWPMVGDGTGGVVVGATGGAYRVAPDGGVERLTTGSLLAVDAERLVRRECDEQERCRVEVVDRATGAVRVVPADQPLDDLRTDNAEGRLDPTGRLLATWADQRLVVVDLTTGSVTEVGHVEWDGPAPPLRWTRQGEVLITLDPGGHLMAWRPGTAGLTALDLPGLPATVNVDVVP